VTPELARADRAAAVREAARSWRRAGWIDEAALAAVASRFPDDRVRVGPVFRALLFLFTAIAVCGGFGFLAVTVASGHDGVLAGLALAAGASLVAATELLTGTFRRRQGGIEAATSLMAIALLLGGGAWWLFSPGGLHLADGWPVFWTATAALTGAAAWRWGYPLYAGIGTAAGLAAVAHLPAGRALWIALPLAAAPALVRLAESPRLPPAHRASATAALLVALAGLYVAVHVGSWDARLVESLGGGHAEGLPPAADGGLARWAAVAAMILMPALLLAAGVWRRRLPLLAAGAAAAIASLATLPAYVHLGPLWLVLTVGGAAWIAVVLGAWRYLEAGPGGERHGFTAAPLTADRARQSLLEAAAAAALTMPAEPRALGAEPNFAGGGGRSGGGGASGEY